MANPAQSDCARATATPRVAVVGCGYWGRNLVRNFSELGALAAVCDANPDVATEQAAKFGLRKRELDSIIADPSIDAVAIATPAELHGTVTWQALEAGKDVFVEKPIALRVIDAERSIAIAAERQRILMVGHLLQYHPAFLKLQEMASSGVFGKLQYIYSNRLNLGKIRQHENILWSFAPHDISMILALARDMPSKVQAVGSYYLHQAIADVTATHLAFPSGINAHIFVSWLHPNKEQKLILVGSDGMAVFDDTQPWERKLAHYAHSVTWLDNQPVPQKAEPGYVALTPSEPLAMECAHFLNAVRTRSQPRTDGAEGLSVLRVLDAAERSMVQSQTVNLGDEKEAPAATDPMAPGQMRHFVHESSYVDDGATVGDGTAIWHFSHILKGSRIGRNCVIGQNVMIGPDVSVGDHCKIQNNVSLYKGVILEEGVFCGPSCVFTNVINPRAEVERKNEFKPTYVERGATIGANATIVCGNRLGAYSFVAAGAVVTNDVPPHALVAGCPARIVGWMSHAGERLDDCLVCPRSGRRYRFAGENQLTEILGSPEETGQCARKSRKVNE